MAPENTIAAMRCGLARGFHAVEFDVMLSRDEVPILMHDPDLGRTVTGSGKVSDCSARELLAMDAGAWFGAEFAGETIPSFAQTVSFCKENGIWMNIEIKPAPGFDVPTGRIVGEAAAVMFAQEIAASEDHRNQVSLPLFSSFSFDALMAAKLAAPGIPRGYLADVIPPDWRAQLDALGAIALHTNQKNLSEALARDIKDAGFGLFCYTVNDIDRARQIMAWGVDGFCTDRIDLIGPEFS